MNIEALSFNVWAEPLAEAAEGGNHGVGDEQHAVAVADLAHPPPVARRRHEAPARVLHGLQDDGGDELGALSLDHLLYRVGGPLRVLLSVLDVEEARRQGLERRLEGGQTRDRERAHRGAVVGDVPGDDLVPSRLPVDLVVLPGELDGGLHRLRARGDEERAVEVPGRYLGDLVRKLQAPRVQKAPVGEEAELLHLPGGDLG
jgi:hypothetical protein